MTDNTAAAPDLAAFDLAGPSEKGATMELLHPVTGAKLHVSMEVMGSDAPKFRKNLRQLRDILARTPDDEDMDQDVKDVLAEARISACAVKAWSGVVYQGEAMPFTFDNAVKVFSGLPWIGQQVALFRSSRANFFKG